MALERKRSFPHAVPILSREEDLTTRRAQFRVTRFQQSLGRRHEIRVVAVSLALGTIMPEQSGLISSLLPVVVLAGEQLGEVEKKRAQTKPSPLWKGRSG